MQYDLKEKLVNRAVFIGAELLHIFKANCYLRHSYQIFCHWQIHCLERQLLGDKNLEGSRLDKENCR